MISKTALRMIGFKILVEPAYNSMVIPNWNRSMKIIIAIKHASLSTLTVRRVVFHIAFTYHRFKLLVVHLSEESTNN